MEELGPLIDVLGEIKDELHDIMIMAVERGKSEEEDKDNPATENQLAYMQKHNLVIPNHCTKGQAWMIIKKHKNRS